MKTSLMRTLALMFCTATPAFCEDSPQKAAKLDIEIKAHMDYWIYLPQDYDKQEKVPLLLFLHGAGERGSDLNKVKVHGPPKLIAAGRSGSVPPPNCSALDPSAVYNCPSKPASRIIFRTASIYA